MNQKLQFFIGKSDDGKFYAASSAGIYFCFECDTEESAVQAGLEAFALHLSLQEKNGKSDKQNVREASRTAWTSIERCFTPKQVINAIAC